jgi:hypothetical protein
LHRNATNTLLEAVEKLIHDRLAGLGLTKLPLPRGTPIDSPHVPIFCSSDLASKSRIVLLIGESVQDLGILAHRVATGPGGLNKGSMVSIVSSITSTQRSSPEDDSPPGIVIANSGQLWWWPEGKKALTTTARHAVPMASAVHWGRFYDEQLNAIPRNTNPAAHVRCVFEDVLGCMTASTARIDIIAVGDSADEIEAFLNNDETWRIWGPRLNSLALLGGYYRAENVTCDGFGKFLREVSWLCFRCRIMFI